VLSLDASPQNLIIEELHRLETAGYVGLLGTKYLSEAVTTPDKETGNRVLAINVHPAAGWAIVAWGPEGDEAKYKFIRDVDRGWVYDGLEGMETVN